MSGARIWALCAAPLLGGCVAGPHIDRPPPPQTITVREAVPTPCLAAGEVPPAPAPVGATLNGDARHDIDLLAAAMLRMRVWQREVEALLAACEAPVAPPPGSAPGR